MTVCHVRLCLFPFIWLVNTWDIFDMIVLFNINDDRQVKIWYLIQIIQSTSLMKI